MSLGVMIFNDFRNKILLKQNTAVYTLTWQENVSNACVTDINQAAPVTSLWSFPICGKTKLIHYWNVLLKIYQHMYPGIICLLHLGIWAPITAFYFLRALSDPELRFMIRDSSIKLALFLVTFGGGEHCLI